MTGSEEDDAGRVDTEHASSARIYDFFLGGKDNYRVDRAAAERILQVIPYAQAVAVQNRKFMHRAVAELSGLGALQFLDIGTGIPTEPNLHQVAQSCNSEARVVYVDNDPLVLAHARALLRGTNAGCTAYIAADLTDPAAILAAPELHETLDLDTPMVLSMVAVLHFLTDEQDPRGVVRTLMDALAPGSFLVLSHATADLSDDMAVAIERYRESGIFVTNRDKSEFAGYFDGLELLDPGIVPTNRWRPIIEPPKWQDAQVGVWAAVARKP